MKYFGKVFVEWKDGNKWNLSAISWHKYLLGRVCGVIGGPESDKDYRHVPRNKINYV